MTEVLSSLFLWSTKWEEGLNLNPILETLLSISPMLYRTLLNLQILVLVEKWLEVWQLYIPPCWRCHDDPSSFPIPWQDNSSLLSWYLPVWYIIVLQLLKHEKRVLVPTNTTHKDPPWSSRRELWNKGPLLGSILSILYRPVSPWDDISSGSNSSEFISTSYYNK